MAEPALKNLLLRAEGEIRDLRRQNEVLAAKVNTMELLGALLFASPERPGGLLGEDVAWQLHRAAEEFDKASPEPPVERERRRFADE